MDGVLSDVIIPAPESAGSYLELSGAKNARGTVFRKHLLTLGDLVHPESGKVIKLDDSFYSQLEANFRNNVTDHVAVPLADASNRHSEDPLRNTGEVIGLHRDGRKVFVDLDIRDPKVVDGLRNGTLLGASAFISMDYKDNQGRHRGPALLHSCITNRPYCTGLDPYEEVIAATAADSSGEPDVAVLTVREPAEGVGEMDKDELIAALRDEHGIDVEALQATASQQAQLSELTGALTAALSATPAGDHLRLSGDGGMQVSASDLVGAVAELAQHNVALSNGVLGLQRKNAEAEVDALVKQGRVLPAQRNAYVTLSLTNREMFDELLPDKALVPVEEQSGVGGEDGYRQQIDQDAEIARLTQQYAGKIVSLNGAASAGSN
jgi:Mu-like prophage I protein